MPPTDADPTRPSLLRSVANLGNQHSWAEFFGCYDPLLRRWCHRFRLDPEMADELCQRMWIELMRRMPSYRYDPGDSFRGWLWFLFRRRALTLVKERQAELACLVDATIMDAPYPYDDDEPDTGWLWLLREAEEVQAKVKGRVKPGRWEAFWRIIVLGEDIGQTAAALGVTYAAAYAAARHVNKMLRDEGRRRESGTTYEY